MIELFYWAAATLIVPLAIAFIPFLRDKLNEKTLHVMLGVSAGILLGISLLEIMPEAFHLGAEAGLEEFLPGVAVGIGFFTLMLVERFMLGRGHSHDTHHKGVKPFGTMAMTGLVLHGFIDGFIIPLGFAAGQEVGFMVGLAVVLHQIPDTFVAISVVLGAGHTKKRAFLATLLSAVDTPIGMLAGVLFLGLVPVGLIPLALGFSAGSFLFIAAADIIPELQHQSRSLRVTISIIAGFALIALLSAFLPHA